MTDPARADLETLYRIFTVPEAADSTLGAIDREITADVSRFLREHIVATEHSLDAIERAYADPRVPETPTFVSDYTEFLQSNLVAHSVHTAAPGFIGHMTSALPYFMLPLARIMIALNQNLVKVETSKAFTPMERQVLAMMHHTIYGYDDEFYARWMHEPTAALGAFCSGGTVANITALWAARNRLGAADGSFPGIAQAGLAATLEHLDCAGLAILVSRRGHYSLGKAADLLGIGRQNLIAVETDSANRIDLGDLVRAHQDLVARRIRPLALVGIAGTTETGSIDPIDRLADAAADMGCHFHVDAAWGGPTLFSTTHRPKLAGIERADSVTIDAHKQMYVPMGAGMVLFRDPHAVEAIEHHANYILRQGSKDLGAHSLEGSRPGMAMLVHAGMSIIGRQGYELLIDRGIERAQQFAAMISAHPDFELISEPELNILTYRLAPADLQRSMRLLAADGKAYGGLVEANALLDRITEQIQKQQREAGATFVSRTRLPWPAQPETDIAVFRVVLANPLTTEVVLESVLAEQSALAATAPNAAQLRQIEALLT